MLGTCNTCVRLQSRVTSSGATVNSWMNFLFIYLFYLFFFSLFYFIFMCLFTYLCIALFPFSPLFVCFAAVDFVFICYWPNFFVVVVVVFFVCCFFCHAGFISLWVGLIFCWLENNISYLGDVYKFLSRVWNWL